jgi:hypothetical protein
MDVSEILLEKVPETGNISGTLLFHCLAEGAV